MDGGTSHNPTGDFATTLTTILFTFLTPPGTVTLVGLGAVVSFRFFLPISVSRLLPFLLALHVGVCLLLIVAVLMQRTRSEGLGTAFGGRVTDNIFGAQASSVLAKVTTYLGTIFFVLTLLLAIAYARTSAGHLDLQRELNNLSPPPKSSSPAR
ncbi:MAG: preprotein translocase subunit SecG [Candidatus Xiphinematobacter sp.]|nr:MAG: preprotein translocase subunit SecG [Candidatus Xiphinematobacter sp.]